MPDPLAKLYTYIRDLEDNILVIDTMCRHNTDPSATVAMAANGIRTRRLEAEQRLMDRLGASDPGALGRDQVIAESHDIPISLIEPVEVTYEPDTPPPNLRVAPPLPEPQPIPELPTSARLVQVGRHAERDRLRNRLIAFIDDLLANESEGPRAG